MLVTNITTILFDLDGTLVKHGHVLLPPLLADWGYPREIGDIEFVVEEQLHWVYQETIKAGEWTPAIVHEWQSRILRGLDIPDPDGKKVQQLLDYYRTDPVPPLYEDAVDLLKCLDDSGYQMGIITQRGRRGTESFLEEHGIGHHFKSVVCGNDGHGRKPTSGPFLASLKNLDCQANEAIFIGDRVDDDCDGALGAGLAAFLIDRYDRFRQEVQERDDIIYLTTLTELNNHLPTP